MTQDSFTILEQISQSPTTGVYKVHQNALGRTVLLKVLHKHLLRDKELVSRFSREARACAILKSENIVQVYDLTEIDGSPAIVIEYIEGKSLEDLLMGEGSHSEELLLKVAVSVLKALSYAHGKGVTHRDIKPGNILVSENGTIKVTDFGLAAVSDAPSLTMEGSLIGTPAYMSPEQARGETVDNRTDLFSLGVTLVEVLTGERILAGKSYAECINRIQDFDLSTLDPFASKCSPHVFEFLKKLLAPNRDDRFASADQALEFLLPPGESTEAKEETHEARTKARNNWLSIGAVGVVLVLVVVLSFVFRHPSQQTVKTSSGSAADTLSKQPVEKIVGQEKSGTAPERNDASYVKKQSTAMKDRPVDSKPQSVPAPHEEPSRQVAAPAGIDSGYISVACTPWAHIYIDNEYAGTTPIAGSIRVPAGKHTVTFNNPSFAPVVKQVDVRPKLLASVDADFLKNSGYIFVSVEPWGDVYIDDQFRETTPSSKPIVVSAGTRRLRIHNPSFQDIVRDLTINPGDTVRLDFSFLTKKEK